ncbi:response regulator transcription factor [Pseudobacteriovorax antillogorgiicola]|uniref:Response regulator receiver protein n=1 Tax=Pseudobacteriovorax antillogorgiicola TaxID=1513793 RepID=A0A1Y6C0J8_9BACT|nr:response regulator [Pseudobacteriovorax antillogorgiicola]TCS52372.1 response regulator receiver protein [Pseudobacteriovorax antillogorgiicola]SMF29349.1 response regulator receiver protein [Pseudobacteriovorax antillogorgiicola]
MKILVTDDSRSVHGFIEAMFVDTPHELEHAYDGTEALDQIKGGLSVDVILLDWEMPQLSGVEALKALREQGCAIPILMVTSRNNVKNIAEALEGGANEYIMKPFTKDILFEKLEMVLGRKVA